MIKKTNTKTDKLVKEIKQVLDSEFKNNINELYKDFCLIIKKNKDDEKMMRLDFLEFLNDQYDYFKILETDIFLEKLYIHGILNENLTNNKNIPMFHHTGHSYGNFFEKEVVKILKRNFNVFELKGSFVDCLLKFEDVEYILEIKSNKTQTKKQTNRYKEFTGIENVITINGSENSINLNVLQIKRYCEEVFDDMFLNDNQTKMEE